MKRFVCGAALVAAMLIPTALTPALAAGGSGGSTATGGGAGVKTCSPSVAATAAALGAPTYRTLTITYATACASRSKTALSATNLRTNTLEWALADNGLASNVWASPQWDTTYRIDVRTTDNTTGALMATGSTTVTTPKLPANCGPTLAITPVVGTTGPDWGIAAGVSAFWCQGPTNVLVSFKNATTGATESSQYAVSGSATLPHPNANTTYNITATAYDGLTGSALTSATATATVGSYPVDCGPTMTLAPTAGTTAAGWGVNVAVSSVFCIGATNVLVTLTNASTGLVEFTGYASSGSIRFASAHANTTYNVAATMYDATNARVLATATGSAATGVLPPNCATITNLNVTTGYWGIYPAIWISTSARDCGYGGQHVHVQVTDISTGVISTQYDAAMTSVIDFEGAIVKYNNDYRFDVEVRGTDNELLDSRSVVVRSSP